MKLYRSFRIRQKGFPKVFYRLICLTAPQSARADEFEIEARTGETLNQWKIAMLVTLCRAFGLARTPRGEPGTYGLDASRNYEESDLVTCELLLIGGQPKYQIKAERDKEGRLLLTAEFARGLRLGSAWNFTVVSKEVRQLLEVADLQGLTFREGVTQNPTAEPRSFWEIQSSIVLPKMANTDRLMYCGWRETPPQPFTGDYSRMVFIDDPPYRSGEIHYWQSDLAPLGKLDVATTFELYRQPYPALVISQRFYQTCLKNGIALNVEPVRVDTG
jgi:hypothetical protein